MAQTSRAQAGDDPGQHIARTAGREACPAAAVKRKIALRIGQHRRWPFQNHHRAKILGPLQQHLGTAVPYPVRVLSGQGGHLSGMRCKDQTAVNQPQQRQPAIACCHRSRVKDDAACAFGGQQLLQHMARCIDRSHRRPDRQTIAVVHQIPHRRRVCDFAVFVRRQREHASFRQRHTQRDCQHVGNRQLHLAGTGLKCRFGRQAQPPRHQRRAADQHDTAAGVLVDIGVNRQRMRPKPGGIQRDGRVGHPRLPAIASGLEVTGVSSTVIGAVTL